MIKAGGACDLLKYDYIKHDEFSKSVQGYDALIVRINPGQLSQIPGATGVQEKFDSLMDSLLAKGKLVWSSPGVQAQMNAKDALVMIKELNCGLVDTFAYSDAKELEEGFKKTCAFQPRVIKQNRGSAGEGIWLVWLDSGKYPAKHFGDVPLGDGEKLKLMEMNDNHVEYHTVGEFLKFCIEGPDAPGAGSWKSTFPGKYLDGGKAAGGQLVDQRLLLPRVDEGEVRMLMAGDQVRTIIRKKPTDGLSAVGGNSIYTYYEPGCAEYADLENKFINEDVPKLMVALGLPNDPLPLIWTVDFIPKDAEDGIPGVTKYVVSECNCSCVGISMFQAVCDGDKTLADVPDADYLEASKLTDLMGVKALEVLQRARETGAAARIALFVRFAVARSRALARGPGIGGLLPLLTELAANSRERGAGGALRTLAARDTVRAIFARLGSLQKRAAAKVPWLQPSELLYGDPEGSSTAVDVKSNHILELSALFEDINALLQGSKHCTASPDEVLLISGDHDTAAHMELAFLLPLVTETAIRACRPTTRTALRVQRS